MTPEEIERSKRDEPELWQMARAIRKLMELAAACGVAAFWGGTRR